MQGIKYPPVRHELTFKKAPKAKGKHGTEDTRPLFYKNGD